MNNPIEYEMLARIQQTELLKAAAERRAARIAQGDARPLVARGWAIALSAAVLAMSLVLLTGLH